MSPVLLAGRRVERKFMEEKVKFVMCVLVTGENAMGFYSGVQKSDTGSYLVENVTTECGKIADYAWAESINEEN